jgi:hypothetical protein
MAMKLVQYTADTLLVALHRPLVIILQQVQQEEIQLTIMVVVPVHPLDREAAQQLIRLHILITPGNRVQVIQAEAPGVVPVHALHGATPIPAVHGIILVQEVHGGTLRLAIHPLAALAAVVDSPEVEDSVAVVADMLAVADTEDDKLFDRLSTQFNFL